MKTMAELRTTPGLTVLNESAAGALVNVSLPGHDFTAAALLSWENGLERVFLTLTDGTSPERGADIFRQLFFHPFERVTLHLPVDVDRPYIQLFKWKVQTQVNEKGGYRHGD